MLHFGALTIEAAEKERVNACDTREKEMSRKF